MAIEYWIWTVFKYLIRLKLQIGHLVLLSWTLLLSPWILLLSSWTLLLSSWSSIIMISCKFRFQYFSILFSLKVLWLSKNSNIAKYSMRLNFETTLTVQNLQWEFYWSLILIVSDSDLFRGSDFGKLSIYSLGKVCELLKCDHPQPLFLLIFSL